MALLGPVDYMGIFYRTLRASSSLLKAPTAAFRERTQNVAGSKLMQDSQILEALELLMPEKNNANTDVHASSEEDTNVGEERI